MAPRKSKAAQTAVEEEIDYTVYADKPPTDLQERFTDWILDKTEYDPASEKTKKEAFAEGVRLGVALRMKFQASPENQAVLEERKAARDDDEAPAPKAKPARKAKAKPEPEPDEDELEEDEENGDDDTDDEAPAPKRSRRAAARPAKAAPAKKAPARRKAKAAAATGGDAPF